MISAGCYNSFRKEERNIKILESFIRGKKSKELCEDSFVISDDFIAVIDGVTSKSDFAYQGKTTGKLASEITEKVIRSLDKETSVNDFVSQVNQEIKKFYETVEFPYSKKEKGLQAACVVYSKFRREIWMIGDCQVSVDNRVYLNPKKSDVVLSDTRSLALHILKAEKTDWEESQKIARNLIEPWILRANVFANQSDTEYGYAMLNGEKIPESLIKIIKLDEKPHKIIFTSDGYPRIKADLKNTEKYLEDIIKSDAACYERYLSTKGKAKGQESFDDRTYVSFLV